MERIVRNGLGMSNRVIRAVWLASGLVVLSGCGEDSCNRTASLGGDISGSRGQVQIVFINNTPFRSVFTFGTYDQTDQSSEPDFRQFANDPAGLILEGDSTNPIGALECARVFSIGGPRLLALIAENLPDAPVADEALIEGVEFLSVPDDSSGATPTPVSQGTSPPFEALIGVDFPCGALIIIRFEIDDLGPAPFRVDFELIP